jgi:hypothetical protein
VSLHSIDTAALKEATGSAPKPVAGLMGIGIWIMGYGLIAYLRMGFAASVFIALPTMVLAIGFAVLGFVGKEPPCGLRWSR